jgi:hypothetical protein
MSVKQRFAVGLTILAVVPVIGFATALPVNLPDLGELDIGNASGVLVGVSTGGGGCVNWNTASATCLSTTAVNMNISGLDSTDFTFPSTGTINDIPQGTTSIMHWETAPSPLPGGTVFFDLTGVPNATVPPGNDCSSGNLDTTCVAPNSPFVLFQASATQVNIVFVADANAYTGTSGTGVTPYTADFHTSLSGSLAGFGCVVGGPQVSCSVNIPDVLTFEALGGKISSTWSATESPVTTPTPEPLTYLLFGSGLVALAMMRRPRRS